MMRTHERYSWRLVGPIMIANASTFTQTRLVDLTLAYEEMEVDSDIKS